MMAALYNLIVAAGDVLLGWLLHLPREAAPVFLAVATSGLLTFTRPLVTRQDLLGRCAKDKRRLKQLIREARKRRDNEALRRHRSVLAAVSMKLLKAEFKPLLLAIPPVMLLGVWGFERLGYLPLAGRDEVTVKAYFRASAIDKVAHMAPTEGIEAPEGWVRRVAKDPHEAAGQVNGIAEWTLRAEPREEPYELLVRVGDQTVRKELLVDARRYAPPLELYEGAVQAVEIVMERYKPFGVVPGIPYVLPDGWVVVYLVLTVPLVFAFRRLGRIH